MGQALSRQDLNKKIYFESAQFIENEGAPVFHAFFGRQGGSSKGVYNSLNCGMGSDDNRANVEINLQVIANQIGIHAGNILTLHQIHSDKCLKVSEIWDRNNKPQADAFVTDKAGIALGVLTADCAPVLFYGQKADGASVIGAAHAGWKGALGGVLDNTVQEMLALGADISSIRACVGPCIAQSSYEVSTSFLDAFEKDDPENERFFMAGQKEGHLMFDLPGFCAARLARNGLKNVFIKDLDTCFNEEDFFSYRRATHRQEKDYGRQISVIYIKHAENN